MTNQEWDNRFRDFLEILEKLEASDLAVLCSLFECYPTRIGPTIEKEDYIEPLWGKFRHMRHELDDLKTIRDALFALGIRR